MAFSDFTRHAPSLSPAIMAPVKTSAQILASGERMRERQHHYHPGNGGDWKLLSLFVASNEMFIKVSVDIFIQLSPTYTGL